MNKALIIGNLTKDIELRANDNGNSVTAFTVAVPRTYNREETDFINCKAWGKVAENMSKYCGKGSKVAIDGRIQVRSYDAQDGTKKYVTEVIADSVEFLSTKKESEKENDVAVTEDKTDPFVDFSNEVALTDDDLPF